MAGETFGAHLRLCTFKRIGAHLKPVGGGSAPSEKQYMLLCLFSRPAAATAAGGDGSLRERLQRSVAAVTAAGGVCGSS